MVKVLALENSFVLYRKSINIGGNLAYAVKFSGVLRPGWQLHHSGREKLLVVACNHLYHALVTPTKHSFTRTYFSYVHRTDAF